MFGERSHGAAGVYESLAAYFKVDVQYTSELKRLLSWASKKGRFIKLFNRHERYSRVETGVYITLYG